MSTSRDLNHVRPASLSRFGADERGSFSMEFLLWMIVFLPLLAIIVDASMLYQAHSDMWAVARDAARRMALHEMTGPEVQQYALTELASRSQFFFDVTASSTNVNDSVIAIVQIKLNIADSGIFGWFASLYGGEMYSHVEMTFT